MGVHLCENFIRFFFVAHSLLVKSEVVSNPWERSQTRSKSWKAVFEIVNLLGIGWREFRQYMVGWHVDGINSDGAELTSVDWL
mgnify:CR=1 FL=1